MEHHIHIHLSSAGKQASAEVVAPAETQAAPAPANLHEHDQASHVADAILVGAIIGRKRGETGRRSAVEVAKEIVELMLIQLGEADGDAYEIVAVAHIGAGYLMHGSGLYQKQTIAERAVEAFRLI